MTPPEAATPEPPKGGADLSVRVAWSDDAPAIAGVQVVAWRQSFRDTLPQALLDQLDADEIAANWAEAMTRPPDPRNRVLVGLERNQVRGFCVTGPSPDPDADPIQTGELSDLTISPDHLAQGHGSRLVQAAVDTMAADRFKLANVWVNSDADEMRAFLEGAGWAPDGAHRTLEPIAGGAPVKQVRLHAAIGD
jgi:ribosomal protein S18 acetylase RimI-like enzyme